MSVFKFIAAKKAEHSIKIMCRVLEVSRSGFHAWAAREPSMRAREDERLTDRIAVIHAANRKVYGSPRVHAELRLADGVFVGRKHSTRRRSSRTSRGSLARVRASVTRTRPVAVVQVVSSTFVDGR